jgi:hypothetical protein
VDDNVIIDCLEEYQEIGPLAARHTKSLCECLECVIAKLASEKAFSPSSGLFSVEFGLK